MGRSDTGFGIPEREPLRNILELDLHDEMNLIEEFSSSILHTSGRSVQ